MLFEIFPEWSELWPLMLGMAAPAVVGCPLGLLLGYLLTRGEVK